MAGITGLNQCSPLPLFWAGSRVFSPRFDACSGFLAQIVVQLHAKLLGRRTDGLHVPCLQCDPCLWLWSRACTSGNVNRCEK